jgi:hypothetical protein
LRAELTGQRLAAQTVAPRVWPWAARMARSWVDHLGSWMAGCWAHKSAETWAAEMVAEWVSVMVEHWACWRAAQWAVCSERTKVVELGSRTAAQKVLGWVECWVSLTVESWAMRWAAVRDARTAALRVQSTVEPKGCD